MDFLGNTKGDTLAFDYSHEAQGEIFLDVSAAPVTATPEPAEFLPLIGILGGLATWRIRKIRRRAE